MLGGSSWLNAPPRRKGFCTATRLHDDFTARKHDPAHTGHSIPRQCPGEPACPLGGSRLSRPTGRWRQDRGRRAPRSLRPAESTGPASHRGACAAGLRGPRGTPRASGVTSALCRSVKCCVWLPAALGDPAPEWTGTGQAALGGQLRVLEWPAVRGVIWSMGPRHSNPARPPTAPFEELAGSDPPEGPQGASSARSRPGPPQSEFS